MFSDIKIFEIRAGRQTPKAWIESPIWVMVLQAPLIQISCSELGPITFSPTEYSAYKLQLESLSGPHLLQPQFFPDQAEPLKVEDNVYLLPLQTVRKLSTATPLTRDVEELCLLVLERVEVSEYLAEATSPFDYRQWTVYKRIGYLRLFFASKSSTGNPFVREFCRRSKQISRRDTWNIDSCGIPAKEFVLI